MANFITHTMAIERLRRLQGQRTIRKFADDLNLSHQYICDVFSGRRGLGDALLRRLHLEKNPPPEPTYREVQE